MKTWKKIKKDPELLSKYLVREKVIDIIRDFFKSRGFREVFTPTLIPVPSIEPNLEVFETQLRTSKGLKRKGYLAMSPEFSIKKLLAAGIGNCFEITKCFRNEEEVSRLHNPEFTMLEWYRVGADYEDIMKDFENLFIKIIGKEKFKYQGETYDISPPWPKISFKEAFTKYANKNIEDVKDEDFYKIFFNDIEPALAINYKRSLAHRAKPFFIYDYPVSQAALARKSAKDPRFAERFEVFVAGVELGNCFSELTDAGEQRRRFEKDQALRKAQGKAKYPIDEDFLDALVSGLPASAGIAVGVDRLIMLAADAPSISDIILFPGSELFEL